MTSIDHPLVSVVVPVFDHVHVLGRCLKALDAQTYPVDRVEIIVVDNGVGDRVERVVSPYPRARVAREARPGSYAARNEGIGLARGDVLAFTDADCIPDPTWIERGAHRLTSRPDCGLVAGRIEVTFDDPERPSTIELYDSLEFQQRRFVEQRGFAATANMFTLESVVRRVGSFDPSLRSSGDVEWGRRVRSRGFEQVYADDAIVLHPARRTMAELFRKTARIAGGRQDMARKHGRGVRALLTELPGDLLPARRIATALADRRLGAAAKPGIIALAGLLGLVKCAERLRVQLGGRPRRA